ncbi:30S ribosomal protein S2, partial [bacterium]|nr:30S ribosomal protein S2 [bacterium]
MAIVSMRQMLEAGVHFGHQTHRWNPRMKRFIFGERNGIYIIDLEQTLDRAEAAYKFTRDLVANGGTVLFDTRDALTARAGGESSPEQLWLRKLLANVDVPELEPVPRDHVLTKTFYLLESFVGRTTIGQMWIEAL